MCTEMDCWLSVVWQLMPRCHVYWDNRVWCDGRVSMLWNNVYWLYCGEKVCTLGINLGQSQLAAFWERKKKEKKEEKKQQPKKASDQYILQLTVLLTFCQFSSVPCRTECIVMVPVYCNWRSDGRPSILWRKTECTVMEDWVYCDGRRV